MNQVLDLVPALRAPTIEVTATVDPVSSSDAELIVVGVRCARSGAQPGAEAEPAPIREALEAAGLAQIAQTYEGWISRALLTRSFDGSAGSTAELPWPDGGAESTPRGGLVLLGLGSGRPGDLRRAAAAMARQICGTDHAAVTWIDVDDASAQAFVEGAVLGGFHYRISAGDDPKPPVRRLTLAGVSVSTDAVGRGVHVARAGWLSRALALTPSNVKSPQWLVEQADAVATERGLEIEVLDVEDLRRGGFGGLIGVGQGSSRDPSLVKLSYSPPGAGRRTPHVVLVGKGITFDTGGLSIKPAEAMANMKRDMTGAGVVLAAMDALGSLGCPVRVTGLLAIAENAVGGGAMRPGDVLRHYGGRTTEVTNTDAEGRLVLADAMAYAVDKLNPSTLVDVATLTGAVRVALGQRTGGLFTDDEALAHELSQAADSSGEQLWRMPLVADYEERIESKVADADNAGGSPGAITAALFLRHFAGDVRWAHLDLASVGDSPDDSYEWTRGATGFGARLLLHWLCG